MHQLHVVLNTGNTSFFLAYKDKDEAYTAATYIDKVVSDHSELIISLEDSFGHRVSMLTTAVAATMVSNLEEEYEIQVQKKLVEVRAQKKFERMASQDPSMRLVAGVQ